MELRAKRWLAFSGLLVSTVIFLPVSNVQAADKAVGSDGVADLEERVAELEATVARKGNRKVSLVVSGQINKAVVWVDGEGSQVQDNSASESYISLSGEAKVRADFKVGYVLQVGVGEYESFGDDSNGIYVRQSYLYLDTRLGKFSLGQQSLATDSITELTTANTAVAVRPLSFRPLTGTDDRADIFDGYRVNAVRYDTPDLRGFVASAAWAQDGDVWDIAVRHASEVGQFKIAAGLGFRNETVEFSTKDSKTYSGSASVLHIPTGVFLTGVAAKVEDGYYDLGFGSASVSSAKAWQLHGGVEERWTDLGKTTIYAEYGDVKFDGADDSLKIYGLGVVQAVDAAALDVYLAWRRYEADGLIEDASHLDTVIGGARIRF